LADGWEGNPTTHMSPPYLSTSHSFRQIHVAGSAAMVALYMPLALAQRLAEKGASLSVPLGFRFFYLPAFHYVFLIFLLKSLCTQMCSFLSFSFFPLRTAWNTVTSPHHLPPLLSSLHSTLLSPTATTILLNKTAFLLTSPSAQHKFHHHPPSVLANGSEPPPFQQAVGWNRENPAKERPTDLNGPTGDGDGMAEAQAFQVRSRKDERQGGGKREGEKGMREEVSLSILW